MSEEPRIHDQAEGASGGTPPGPVDGEPRTEARPWTSDELMDVLRQVIDPELHMNIVDLGMVYRAVQEGDRVKLDMTLTTPGCPYGPYLLHEVRQMLLSLAGVEEVDLELVWDPPWTPERMTEEARLELGFDI